MSQRMRRTIRGGARCFRALWLVLSGFAVFSVSVAGAAPPAYPVIERFLELHSSVPAVRQRAEAALKDQGLSSEDYQLGWQLTHPDAAQRLALCRELQTRKDSLAQQVQLVLLGDSDAEVRSAALELVVPSTATDDVRTAVELLSQSDSSELVRARARLLLLEWGQTAARGSTRVEEQPASVRIRSQPPRMPPQPNHEPGPLLADPARGFRSLTPVVPYWERSDDSPESAAVSGLQASSAEQAVFEEISGSLHPGRARSGAAGALSLVAGSVALPGGDDRSPELLPELLDRPIEPPDDDSPEPLVSSVDEIFSLPQDPPAGYAGRSGIRPTEIQQNGHFIPREDRWRIGFPRWDRYAEDFPPVTDYPYAEGHWWDPYSQNVLKGDYPILGQHTFMNITATSLMLHEFRQVPTGTTPFESTARPFQEKFFGGPNQYFYLHNFSLQLDLFHGSTAAFKPFDWLVRINPVFNMNYLDADELGIVNPDVRHGTTRFRDDVALEQFFVEAKLADLSPDYDFLSLRVGSQPFVSDFRGFIFADTNLGARLFGTRLSNRDQFNLAYFDTFEKDTNSLLNTFSDRKQQVLIANYFRQDFIFPGYTAQASFHWNHEEPDFHFDDNDFLVRPDPAGVFRPHEIDAFYFGIAGDGHIGRINISNAFYWVTGRDSLNPIAGEPQDIDATLAAVELSYDRDWIRFRTSFMWASGDDDLSDNDAEGFDAISENPNFAGGGFSYWQRNSLRLFGVNLNQREGLLPDLRASKFQGQTNFVNPGLILLNAGMDFEVTPKTRVITNVSYLWFENTVPLEIFTFQDGIDNRIGTDLSIGCEYRPFLNDNVILIGGFSTLIPSEGLDDLFGSYAPFNLGEADDPTFDAPFAFFLETVMTY